jgi:uncharacterized membrane protein
MPTPPEGLDTPRFEAIITPHRSLGPVGLRNLIAFLLILSAAISTGLWFAGAWPVIGFNGAEIVLAIVLLRRNARDRHSVERLILGDAGFFILRTDARGRIWERRLNTAWLNAVIEERQGRAPLLLLVDRGRQHEVGAYLGADEKRDLAQALRSAFHRHRNPVFDNPQLRAD